jgi:hypothetical protein
LQKYDKDLYARILSISNTSYFFSSGARSGWNEALLFVDFSNGRQALQGSAKYFYKNIQKVFCVTFLCVTVGDAEAVCQYSSVL